MDYKHKYLKYKKKYLMLLKGGDDPEAHIRYAFDELNMAIITIINELNCCHTDIMNVYKDYTALLTYGKSINYDICKDLQFVKFTKEPFDQTTNALICSKLDKFLDLQKHNFDIMHDYINKKFNVATIKNINNTIKLATVYQHYKDNYDKPVSALFHLSMLLAQALRRNIETDDLPYVKFYVDDRTSGCDSSIKYDCLLMLFAQKLPRLKMPIDEIHKVLIKLNSPLKQKYDELAKYIKNYIDQINEHVRIIDSHNMTKYHSEYIRLETGQFNKINDILKCEQCNKQKNKKLCCGAPCKHNSFLATCKYSAQ